MITSDFEDEETYLNMSEFTNTSLCAARFIKQHFSLPLSPDESTILRSFQFLYFFILVFSGAILNSGIIWAISMHKKLRNVDMAIAIQVVVISLATIIIVLIPALVNIIADGWVFGAYTCAYMGFIEHTLRSARRSLMVALALDRFLLVFMPFKYPNNRTKFVTISSLLCWTGTIALRIAGLPSLLDCYTLSSANIFCTFVAPCSSGCTILGYTDFAVIHAPFYTIPTLLYLAMYVKGRRLAAKVNSTSPQTTITKGHITFVLLFVTSCVCYLPNIGGILIIQIVVAYKGFSASLGIMLFVLAHSLFLLVVLDALVILRSRDIMEIWLTTMKTLKSKLKCNFKSKSESHI